MHFFGFACLGGFGYMHGSIAAIRVPFGAF